MKTMSKIMILMLLFGFIMITGCSTNSDVPSTTSDYFPVLTEPITKTATIPENGQYCPTLTEVPKAMLADLLQGELVRDEYGYIRVYEFLIIWPFGFSCVIEGDNTWILDDKGNKTIRVGDFVKLGGGGISEKQVKQAIGELLPQNCEGPYYMVSTIVE